MHTRASYTRARSLAIQSAQFALLSDRPGDVFFAAFPRSGKTWLRTMVTNALVEGAAGNPDVFNNFIPGLSLRHMSKLVRRASPRYIATHALWRPRMRRCVLVVRDGHDSVASLYHYVVTRRGGSETFEEFYAMYERRAWGFTWADHTTSWLGEAAGELGDDLLVVRYEEMKRDPEASLRSVLEFLGEDAPEDRLKSAVGHASLRNMRRVEASRIEVSSQDASFYRNGTEGSWESTFTPDTLERFESTHSEALGLAGYERVES